MSQDKNGKGWEEPAIEIDYDNVDVARIMDEIKKKIARQPGPEAGSVFESPPDSENSLPLDVEPDRLEEPQGLRKRMKKFLLKIMSPLSPLIKLLILPVYEEQRQILLALHNTNKRLDIANERLDIANEQINRFKDYTKLLHNLSHNLVVGLSKLKIEVDMLKTKTQIMEKDFGFLEKRERALEKEKNA